VSEYQQLIRLGIPVIDERLGAIYPGGLILVEATPDAYPHVMVHMSLHHHAAHATPVSYIVVMDDPEDYKLLARNMGIRIEAYEANDLWRYDSALDIDDALMKTMNHLSKDRLVATDLIGLKVTTEYTRKFLEIIEINRRRQLLVYIMITPQLIDNELLYVLEKIAEVVFNLKLELSKEGIRRILWIKKTKRILGREAYLEYTLTPRGIEIETVKRVI